MEKISDRIYKMIKNEEIAVRAFEKKIGSSNGLISKFIKNGQGSDEDKFTDIQGKWLSIIIETFPRYDANWLLTGKGDMFKSHGNLNTNQALEPGQKYHPIAKPCEKCIMKDELIVSLKREVNTLTELNSLLRTK